MILGMLALPVGREPIPTGGRRLAAPGPFVTGIGPEPCGLGLSGAGGKHPDRVRHRSRTHGDAMAHRPRRSPLQTGHGGRWRRPMAPTGPCSCRPSRPAWSGRDRALHGRRSGSGDTREDGRRLRGLRGPTGATIPSDLLTSTWARRPGPGRPRSIGREGSGAWTKRSQQAQVSRGRTIRFTMKRPGTYASSPVTSSPIRRRRPPQVRTCVCPGCQFDDHARDMVGDRTALRFVLLFDVGQLHPRRHRGGRDLAGFQRQLQLLGRLGGRAKPVRAVPCQLMPELPDQDRLRLDPGQKPRGEAAATPRGLPAGIRATSSMARSRNRTVRLRAGILRTCRWHRRLSRLPSGRPASACGTRQSIPSSSIDNWRAPASVRPCPPSPTATRTGPFPGASTNRHAPWPSHQMILIRSPRRPRKTNMMSRRTGPASEPSPPGPPRPQSPCACR
jgi:hypothetical protein